MSSTSKLRVALADERETRVGEGEGGGTIMCICFGRDDAPCFTAAVPQLRRRRDLTPLADLRNRAGNAIEADIEVDNEVCSVTASLQNPHCENGTEYKSLHTLYATRRGTSSNTGLADARLP